MYLALIDAQSHWPKIIPVRSTNVVETIAAIRELLTRMGIPREIVSVIGTLKRRVEFSRGHRDRPLSIQQFLMTYRNSPQGSTGKAPAELLYGRRLKTIWDRLRPTTQTTVQSHREKQKERQAPTLPDVNQAVWVPDIIDRTGWGSYVVNTQNGERRRHADDLRTNKEVNTNRGVTKIIGSEELYDHIPSETIRRGTRCRKKPVRYDELAEECERRDVEAATQSMGNSSCNLTANSD
ncbi:hypothetical protein GJ496_007654 [Pomphorhynchus laevis]|nr:hypothetical protein GJ496_007654 [Pomphorhynchus laevis]